MVANDSFPLRHLHRMHLIVSGNLPDRFDAHQSFQSDFGFKGTRVSFPFSFTHSPAVLSPPAEPEKSNLSYCPNFGVHFSVSLRPGKRIGAGARLRRVYNRLEFVRLSLLV